MDVRRPYKDLVEIEKHIGKEVYDIEKPWGLVIITILVSAFNLLVFGWKALVEW